MIREEIEKDLTAVLKKLRISSSGLILEHPSESNHGDYATNIALQAGTSNSKLKTHNAFDLATKIVNTWRSLGLPAYLAKIEIVQPGFINLWLNNDYLITQLEEVIKKGDGFGWSNIGKGKTVVIDYSSPNIAKPFGIGHFRSTIIGTSLANIYRFLCWKVVGINHLGDWGTQFGKIIYQIKNNSLDKLLTVKDLEKLYIDFHKKAEKKPELKEKAREWFKKLEEGDSEAKKIWQMCTEISLKEFNRVYDRLGVKFEQTIGESFYQDKTKEVIETAQKKKLAVKSEGALVIKLPELKGPPALLVKSDGATTYFTRDLAAIVYRQKKWKPVLSIYEVGSEQSFHFQQLFAVAAKLGYGQRENFIHISHGLIHLPGGGKLSTRSGQTVYLEEVLDEAIKRAKKLGCKDEKTAEMIGIGAVKYFDLKNHPATNITFDWNKMFVLEGNSGPYLQYAYARTQSVLRKSNHSKFNFQNSIVKNDHLKLKPEEVSLLRALYKFPEVVMEAGENFSPNLICNFIFDLAQKYNLFYNRLPILKADTEEIVNFRLALTTAVGQVLENGLSLLGISAPEKM
ncbi:MAG: arginine--tRNA ligase [Candidatus Shapirobacteria bacterium]|nr:arginine--tRNA ligase [Candidatus Shapirobacteria bacterium]